MPKATTEQKQKATESATGRKPVHDPMTTEQLVEVSGLPRGYVLGLIRSGVIAPAIEPGEDGERVRSVGLPMLLLQDEVSGCVVAGKLSTELGERVIQQIRPSLEFLWKDVLTRELLTAMVHIPAYESHPAVTVALGFLQDASKKWRRAVGSTAAPRPKK